MRKLTAIKIIAIILIVVIVSFTTIILGIEIQLNRYKLPYKQPYITKIEYEIERPENISYTMLKEGIDKLFDNPNYSFAFIEFEEKTYGQTFIFSRKIKLREGINYEYFVFCLAHELVHLTDFTLQERYCNLTAYNILYKSNNDYFKNIALYFANLDLQGGFSKEYSFVGYL